MWFVFGDLIFFFVVRPYIYNMMFCAKYHELFTRAPWTMSSHALVVLATQRTNGNKVTVTLVCKMHHNMVAPHQS